MDHPDLAAEGLSEVVKDVYQVLVIGGSTHPSKVVEGADDDDGSDGNIAPAGHAHEGGDEVTQSGILHPNYSQTVATLCGRKCSREALV